MSTPLLENSDDLVQEDGGLLEFEDALEPYGCLAAEDGDELDSESGECLDAEGDQPEGCVLVDGPGEEIDLEDGSEFTLEDAEPAEFELADGTELDLEDGTCIQLEGTETGASNPRAVHLSLPWRGIFPVPDGSIDNAPERAQMATYYFFSRVARASAIHLSLPWRRILPIPDSSISALDRIQAADYYRLLPGQTFYTITLTGSVGLSGSMLKKHPLNLEGDVGFTGEYGRFIDLLFSGSITMSGALTTLRVFILIVAGSITPTGVLSRSVRIVLSGTIAMSGLLPRFPLFLAGSIRPTGRLFKDRIRSVFDSASTVYRLFKVDPFYPDSLLSRLRRALIVRKLK